MLRLQELTKLLKIQDSKVDWIRSQVMAAFSNHSAMHAVIKEQCREQGETNCYFCNAEGICFALRGVASLANRMTEDALKELENGTARLRSEDDVWNSAIGAVLMGLAHEQSRNSHEALLHYEEALDLIHTFLLDHENDYEDIERASILKREVLEQLESLIHAQAGTADEKPASNALISFPWMPAYTGLHAGPSGPIWADHLSRESQALMETVILEDSPHKIYSVIKGDNLIVLNPELKYGWAKVTGDSMSASQPVPILENDFVLFQECRDVENGAIVIASCAEKSGAGYQFIVKRYIRNGHVLLSETNPPDLYLPIPIKGETRILGRVLAVAKFEGS